MNTFGKILLVTLLALVAIHVFPVLLVPLVLAGLALLITGLALAGGLIGVAATGLTLVAGVLAVLLVVAALLAPIWLPGLAIYGIVVLCRRNSKVAA